MMTRLPLLIVGTFALAGCVRFGAEPPKTLMNLSSTAIRPAGPAQTAVAGKAVIVSPPITAPELVSLRVPVMTAPNELAYLKDAQWVDAPSRLFRNVLVETIATRTGRVTLEPRQANLGSGARIGGRLLAFGLDAPANEVMIRYDATLIRGTGAPLETRRFEARAPVTVHQAGPVAAAMNIATNQIATEVADWIGQ